MIETNNTCYNIMDLPLEYFTMNEYFAILMFIGIGLFIGFVLTVWFLDKSRGKK